MLTLLSHTAAPSDQGSSEEVVVVFYYILVDMITRLVFFKANTEQRPLCLEGDLGNLHSAEVVGT